jgi:hypothetical protein
MASKIKIWAILFGYYLTLRNNQSIKTTAEEGININLNRFNHRLLQLAQDHHILLLVGLRCL